MNATGITPTLAHLLAQAESAARPAFEYKLFRTPLPVWDNAVWPWLLVPLCVAVAVVYKSIRCQTMRQVPKEATILTIWIVAGMSVAAIALALVVEGLERLSA